MFYVTVLQYTEHNDNYDPIFVNEYNIDTYRLNTLPEDVMYYVIKIMDGEILSEGLNLFKKGTAGFNEYVKKELASRAIDFNLDTTPTENMIRYFPNTDVKINDWQFEVTDGFNEGGFEITRIKPWSNHDDYTEHIDTSLEIKVTARSLSAVLMVDYYFDGYPSAHGVITKTVPYLHDAQFSTSREYFFEVYKTYLWVIDMIENSKDATGYSADMSLDEGLNLPKKKYKITNNYPNPGSNKIIFWDNGNWKYKHEILKNGISRRH